MPQPCYLKIIGKNQGFITHKVGTADSIGDSFVENHLDEIMVQSVKHVVITPTDIQSGKPNSKRIHGALKVTCEINSALPLLYNALCQGETLEIVSLDWYRLSVIGRQEKFFNTTLTNARLSKIQLFLPDSRETKAKRIHQLVNLFFNYRKIEWTHLVANTHGSDDWRKPLEG